jgi:hypothetical protein
VNSMLTFSWAILFQFNAVRAVTLILHRHVIFALA